MKDFINKLASVPVVKELGDYERDGIIYCGKCNEARQCVIVLFGEKRLVPCLCRCRIEESEREKLLLEEFQKGERIKRNRKIAFGKEKFEKFSKSNFENADFQSFPNMIKAKKYCENWSKMKSENIGLLLNGDVGTGKTYFAACIANYLIDNSVPVLMTNFIELSNSIFSEYNKNSVVDSLNNYGLVIFDDLGSERKSEYMQEQVYNIVDARYKSGKPTIFTTNLKLSEFKNPKTTQFERIYDRVMEMTVPIRFDGESSRQIKHKKKLEIAKDMFK